MTKGASLSERDICESPLQSDEIARDSPRLGGSPSNQSPAGAAPTPPAAGKDPEFILYFIHPASLLHTSDHHDGYDWTPPPPKIPKSPAGMGLRDTTSVQDRFLLKLIPHSSFTSSHSSFPTSLTGTMPRPRGTAGA